MLFLEKETINNSPEILNHLWIRQNSFRNDSLVNDLYWDSLYHHQPKYEDFYGGNILLWADDYGYSNFDFRDGQYEPVLQECLTYDRIWCCYYDSCKINRNILRMYSFYYGDKTYKIKIIDQNNICLKYISIMDNEIKIYLFSER